MQDTPKLNISHLKHLREKHEKKLDILFFIAGFIFDALMVRKIDDLHVLIHQGIYLFLIGLFLNYEILYRHLKFRPQNKLTIKIWEYRSPLLHFLLGTLLNVYSIFYIKSSTILGSLFFLLFMVCLLIANELPLIKSSKVSIKAGLYSICLFSYLSILYPLLIGRIGWTPFLLAAATTLLILLFQTRLISGKLKMNIHLQSVFIIPGSIVVAFFILFYWMSWIPPIPVSVKDHGIYHLVEKTEGKYLLHTEKIWWKFWQTSDQVFNAEPNDKIYYYIQVYSPTRISDQMKVVWYWKNQKDSWQLMDTIPIRIQGGREEGYRGFAIKNNYQPGEWRVSLETSAGQEISRMGFDVITREKSENRIFEVITR